MAEERVLSIGDPCPQCGGRFNIDAAESETALEARYAPGGATAVREAHLARTRFKIAASGVLYRCATCGYQTRVVAPPVRPHKALA